MKILAITQARYGSTRLPAKILKEVDGMPLLEIHLRRILRSKRISALKIATTPEEGSALIVAVADRLGLSYCRGSVDDVLARFWSTAAPEAPDYVVRLTSDCPLIDPEVIDSVIDFALEGDYDYAATDPSSFPDGLDTEVFRFSALKRAYEEASLKSEREHVTPYIWKNGSARGGALFKSAYMPNPAGRYGADNYRITLDEPEDFEVLSSLIRALGIGRGWKEYIDYLEANLGLKGVNSRFGYNEGYAKSLREDAPVK
ncbi:MAG: glycosyltransferase family protein [Bacteroidales bacterium]|nr:glycosyltransferase family protein [Bacteroidales bacterium]